MEFEWSETKRLRVLNDRGLDFVDAAAIFDGRPILSVPSPRGSEERWLSIGDIAGHILAVVWCWRGESIRIITMRKARDAEARRYRTLFG